MKEVLDKSAPELEHNVKALLSTTSEHVDHDLDENLIFNSGIGAGDE